jgi:hypothetical protein
VARTEQHADLRKLADKLEAALNVGARAAVPAAGARRPAFAHSESSELNSHPPSDYLTSSFGNSELPTSGGGAAAPQAGRKRYVGSLR